MVLLSRKISVCKRKIFPQMIPAVSSEIWKIKIDAPRNAERFLYAWNLCIKYQIIIAREQG